MTGMMYSPGFLRRGDGIPFDWSIIDEIEGYNPCPVYDSIFERFRLGGCDNVCAGFPPGL